MYAVCPYTSKQGPRAALPSAPFGVYHARDGHFALGEHTEALLSQWLGRSAEAIAALRAHWAPSLHPATESIPMTFPRLDTTAEDQAIADAGARFAD